MNDNGDSRCIHWTNTCQYPQIHLRSLSCAFICLRRVFWKSRSVYWRSSVYPNVFSPWFDRLSQLYQPHYKCLKFLFCIQSLQYSWHCALQNFSHWKCNSLFLFTFELYFECIHNTRFEPFFGWIQMCFFDGYNWNSFVYWSCKFSFDGIFQVSLKSTRLECARLECARLEECTPLERTPWKRTPWEHTP